MTRLFPYCGHYGLSTDHQHRHSQRYPQIRPGDSLCRLRRGGRRTEPWGRPLLKVLEGPMEPFTHTLAVRLMDQDDSHSVKRRGTPIFDIFIRSPARQTRSHDRLKLKKVAMVHHRWIDWNPSEMNCDSRRHWSVVLFYLFCGTPWWGPPLTRPPNVLTGTRLITPHGYCYRGIFGRVANQL